MADLVYGLTTSGLAVKPLDQIRTDINTQLQAKFGASIDVSDLSILGQIAGIVAAAIYEVWELAEGVNSSQDPDKASGQALDALSALTGTFRPAATASVVVLTLTGTGGTLVPAGTLAETASTQTEFATDVDATLVALSAWAGTTAYTLNTRVTNAGRAYQCTTAGTSAGSGGPTTNATSITDGGVTWTYLGEGSAVIDVTATATETGALTGFARDIVVQVSSVSGWSSVVNLLDATPGQDVGTDEILRQLRVAELAGEGRSTQDSIRADLLAVGGVLAVTVFVNNTDATDINGLPPHSIECLVLGGDDQVIANTIYANVAAGIATYSSTSNYLTVVDSQGTNHTIGFTRPTDINIYAVLTVTYDATLYPSNGDSLIQQAIVLWGDAQAAGKDVVSNALVAQAFSIAGVLDVPTCFIGTAPSPVTSTTIPISLRQLAVYDTTRISVTSTPGTP